MHYLIVTSAAAIVLLTACNTRESAKEYAATADSTSFAGDITSLNSSSRKIARTADISCRVRNVEDATIALENTVKQLGGLVAESHIENRPLLQQTLSYKPDSLRQVMSYSPTSHLVLRVPDHYLDSLLHLLPQIAEFTDRRLLRQDDKTLAYLANALKNEAVRPAQLKTKIADTGANTLQFVDRRIQNLQILDEVHYATVSVELTQPEQVYTTTIVNTGYLTEEPFGRQLAHSLYTGWSFILNLFVALVALWPLWLLAAVGWSWYVVRKKRMMS